MALKLIYLINCILCVLFLIEVDTREPNIAKLRKYYFNDPKPGSINMDYIDPDVEITQEVDKPAEDGIKKWKRDIKYKDNTEAKESDYEMHDSAYNKDIESFKQDARDLYKRIKEGTKPVNELIKEFCKKNDCSLPSSIKIIELYTGKTFHGNNFVEKKRAERQNKLRKLLRADKYNVNDPIHNTHSVEVEKAEIETDIGRTIDSLKDDIQELLRNSEIGKMTLFESIQAFSKKFNFEENLTIKIVEIDTGSKYNFLKKLFEHDGNVVTSAPVTSAPGITTVIDETRMKDDEAGETEDDTTNSTTRIKPFSSLIIYGLIWTFNGFLLARM